MQRMHKKLKISCLISVVLLTLTCHDSFATEVPALVLNQIHPAVDITETRTNSAPKISFAQTDTVLRDRPIQVEKINLESETPKSNPLASKSGDRFDPITNEEPISLRIAQSTPQDSLGDTQPIDLTPVSLPRRAPSFDRFDRFQAGALYKLPAKMFFSLVVDNSVRLETNVFQTNSANSSDFVYRVLPNLTLGYALNKRTRIACNYFLLRDQYTEFNRPLSRNFQSVGFRIDHDVPLRGRANLSFGFFGRALFTNLDYLNDTFFNDLIPSVTLTKPIGRRTIAYASCLGQIRFKRMLNRYQEFDQFYSGGLVHRRGTWTFLLDNTLVSNFGRPIFRGGGNNQVFILTQEAARRIHHKIPLQVYLRGQEIFNVGAPLSPGFAGYNYRIFAGVRLTVAKPPIFPIKLKSR